MCFWSKILHKKLILVSFWNISFKEWRPASSNLLHSVDKTSLVALKKLKKHLWHLSEELIRFSFFYDSIIVGEKKYGAEIKKICRLWKHSKKNCYFWQQYYKFLTLWQKNFVRFFKTSSFKADFLTKKKKKTLAYATLINRTANPKE